MLPQLPDHECPSNLVITADALSGVYLHTLRVVDQDQSDPPQVEVHLAAIEHDALPLLLAIKQDSQSSDMNEWLVTTTTQFGAFFFCFTFMVW